MRLRTAAAQPNISQLQQGSIRRMASPRRRTRGAAWLVLILVLTAAGLVTLGRKPLPRAPLPPRVGPALSEAKTWGYQLQKVRPRLVPAGIDVLVVDYSRDGSADAEFTPTMIEMLRRRPDGRPRIVLCYMSIGEAEDYRYYWWSHWRIKSPAWLGRENKQWKGNYPVRFWDRDWQRLIVEPDPSYIARLVEANLSWRKPYLDRILEMGFDGVYLDRVDVFQEWEKSRRSARTDMVRFVTALSRYAKARKPGFLVVPQNAEELLMSPAYRKAIDGIAKEDLYFGVGGDGVVNDREEAAKSLELLAHAKAAGLPVLVVEYLVRAEQRLEAQREIERQGFIPLFADRALATPPQLVPPLPPPSLPSLPPQAPPPAPAEPPPKRGKG
jgi:cysteinyl-tRNA synthetase